LLPYDDCNADVLLNELAQGGFILRYSSKNEPVTNCIQIINFTKHQKPHHKETASEIEKPYLGACQHVPKSPLTLNPYPLLLTLYTLTLNAKKQVNKKPPNPLKGELVAGYENDFNYLHDNWKGCNMKKGSRKNAIDAYNKARMKTSAKEITDGAGKYLRSCHASQTKTKHISTWLNADGWLDDNELPENQTKGLPNEKTKELDRQISVAKGVARLYGCDEDKQISDATFQHIQQLR